MTWVASGTAGLFDAGGAPDAIEARPLVTLARGGVFTAALAREVRRCAHRWDAIVAHWLVPSAVVAATTDRPVIAIAHGGDVHTLRRARLLAPVLHGLRARGVELVFVSEALRTIARAAAPALGAWLARARVQPMGLDVARFAAIARLPATPPVLAVIARLVAIKGVDVALAAHARIAPGTRLVIAGDGPLRDELRAHARRLADREVVFLGAVDADRRDALLAEAAAVLVPSRELPTGRAEGMPMVALEALAAGVPVIASAVGGLSELAPHATLVRPDCPTSLAAAIDRTLAAPPALSALRAAVAHLAWPDVARAILTRVT